MRQLKVTPEIESVLRTEAALRAKSRTNKQIAETTGLAPMYVAQMVARFRREIELNVSRESSTV